MAIVTYAGILLNEKKYDQLKTYGVGRDIPARDWQDYLLQMLNLGYFEVAYNEKNHLKITEAGKKVLFGKERAQLVVIKREEHLGQESKRGKKKAKIQEPQAPVLTPAVFENEDEYLFEELRVLRKKLADKTLHLLSSAKPTTIEAFGEISGIGEFKKEKYGKDFVEVIRRFLNKSDK